MNPNVWESGASATPPAAPTTPSTGYPSPGDPAGGVQPTKGGAYWFHQISEELAAILTAAGITPDHEDLAQLLAALDAMYAPKGVGRIEMFAMSTAPAGYMKANGALVSRTTYASLFAAIGTTFGVGDGSTTFGLPDLRGEFLRVWDDARGVDIARVFGSAQVDAFQGHSHTASLATGGSIGVATTPNYKQHASASIYSASYTGSQNQSDGNATATDPISNPSYGTASVASETRPRNIALLACIKF